MGTFKPFPPGLASRMMKVNDNDSSDVFYVNTTAIAGIVDRGSSMLIRLSFDTPAQGNQTIPATITISDAQDVAELRAWMEQVWDIELVGEFDVTVT